MTRSNRHDVRKAVVKKLSRQQLFRLCLLFLIVLLLALLKTPALAPEFLP